MSGYPELASYRQRTRTETSQLRDGLLHGVALALALWAMLAWLVATLLG